MIEQPDEFSAVLDMVRRRVELEAGFGIDRFPKPKPPSRPATQERSLQVEATRREDSHRAAPPSRPEQARPATPPPQATGDKAELLRALHEQAAKCTGCALHRTRRKFVFGAGNPNADLMFVGEAPGYHEDLQGEPFVGPAGQLLTRMIAAIQMTRSEVYIANVLKCRPAGETGDRPPHGDEIVMCWPHLRRQIEIIRPKLICALGATASQAVLQTKQGITALRGHVHRFGDIPVIPTFHPSYLLRSPDAKVYAWEDLQKVRDMLKELRQAKG
ncbi:MAG: uracil-DNA glycosylase [Planctomycetes bacterium]|nr:uracil-DNA glycosylase [Planctomycetota bacterium]